jgi:hypothetical protein
MTIDRAIEILNPEHRECYDGLDEVNEACRMGMEALERTRWIPCSERMPERPGDYQVCTKNEYYGTKNVAKRYFNGDCWSGRWTNITHWMPLPEPPEEVQKNE